jgi:hypothetical protein
VVLSLGLSWCELAEGAVRPGSVIVLQVFGQRPSQVVLIDNQHPVQELPAQGADDPLADRITPHHQLRLIRTIGTSVSG